MSTYDTHIVDQLLVFGYKQQDIIYASTHVVDYKDINEVREYLDSHTVNDSEHSKCTKSKSNKTKKKKKKKKKLKMEFPPPSPTKLLQSKSADSGTRKSSKLLKRNKKDASWIKQGRVSAADPASFSRQSSILKLRQIAAVSKTKRKTKKMTLIDIIYEDEENENENEQQQDDKDETLMPPMLGRRSALSADSGMNELLTHKNQHLDLEQQEQESEESWITHKKQKKQSHAKAELALLFDFRFCFSVCIYLSLFDLEMNDCVHIDRDFESKNNRTKEYEESIQNIQSEQAQKAMELMKQKTFNAVKLQQEIKEKAIEGLSARLEVQKKLMQAGYTASPLLHDDDFLPDDDDDVDNDDATDDVKESDTDEHEKKLNRRDLLKQALKNESTAMAHCVMIVEELGFLKYMKDDETYMQLMKSKQNALQREIAKKKQKQQHKQQLKSPQHADNDEFQLPAESTEFGGFVSRSRSRAIELDQSDDDDEEEEEEEEQLPADMTEFGGFVSRSRSRAVEQDRHDSQDEEQEMNLNVNMNAAQMALQELKQEMEADTKKQAEWTSEPEPHIDLFCMSNSNLLLSLKPENCHLLMRIISKSLVSIKSLRFVQLCNCGVDDYFMSQIVLQFMENQQDFKIESLDLQSNSIGDNGMRCLCELMKANNQYLKTIRLQNNRRDISTTVCKEMCEALEINDFVVKFEFEFRHYGEKDRSYQALKRNVDKARIERVSKLNDMLLQ